MNKKQKEVMKRTVQEEQRILKELKEVYKKAQEDCAKRIKKLSQREDFENLQSIIYQTKYQKALKKQIDDILDELNKKEFTSVSDYLKRCYENGYLGVMYDLQGQGIPIMMPINQEEVVKAIEINSKISTSMYKKMGENTDVLKKAIRFEVTRGIANGSSWNQIAKELAIGMNTPFKGAYNKTLRIARTEGHRVQQEASYNAQCKAIDRGAEVVKQWDATLDSKTRPEHQKLDGKLVEVKEPFKVGDYEGLFPGGFGVPSLDCNCRCAILQRAKWALDEDELDELKSRAKAFGLDKTNDFEDFKQKYMSVTS